MQREGFPVVWEISRLYLVFTLGCLELMLLGIFLLPFSAVVGFYSLLFGVPQWVLGICS